MPATAGIQFSADLNGDCIPLVPRLRGDDGVPVRKAALWFPAYAGMTANESYINKGTDLVPRLRGDDER